MVQAVTQAMGSGRRSFARPPLTSCCAAWFLTGWGPVPVCGPGVRDPCSATYFLPSSTPCFVQTEPPAVPSSCSFLFWLHVFALLFSLPECPCPQLWISTPHVFQGWAQDSVKQPLIPRCESEASSLSSPQSAAMDVCLLWALQALGYKDEPRKRTHKELSLAGGYNQSEVRVPVCLLYCFSPAWHSTHALKGGRRVSKCQVTVVGSQREWLILLLSSHLYLC